jgi:hypothetical protein
MDNMQSNYESYPFNHEVGIHVFLIFIQPRILANGDISILIKRKIILLVKDV